MKRDAASTIFRTVVFAGAMLGAGCGKKPAPQTPAPDSTANPQDPAMMQGDPAKADGDKPDPCAAKDPCAADPCAGGERPRGTDDDGGGGTGRGFILS
jgi:hypothetical protein